MENGVDKANKAQYCKKDFYVYINTSSLLSRHDQSHRGLDEKS